MALKTTMETTERTDAEIARDIRRRMKADFEVPDDSIAVRVIDGFVTIEGIVTRESQKAAAEVCARRVKGVHGISNEILVEPATPPSET